jgi:hypothetical protein
MAQHGDAFIGNADMTKLWRFGRVLDRTLIHQTGPYPFIQPHLNVVKTYR